MWVCPWREARGLSREQSKLKADKKKAGENKGNQEGLNPQQRAERCVPPNPERPTPNPIYPAPPPITIPLQVQ